MPSSREHDAGSTPLPADAAALCRQEAVHIGDTLLAAPEPHTHDLYNGTPGVALLFAYLERITGLSVYGHAADARLEPSIRAVLDDRLPAGGAFTGAGSVLLSVLAVQTLSGRVLCDPPTLERATHGIARSIATDTALDIVSGCAGLLHVFLQMSRVGGVPSTLDAARACGDRLLATRIVLGDACGWQTIDRRPLAGFAHGGAGIGAALYALADATGVEAYAAAAAQAFAYERRLYVPARRNWKDVRASTAPADRDTLVAWCHGAAGIALSRAQLPVLFQTTEHAHDLQCATDTTDATPQAQDCLCHGELGTIDILLTLATLARDEPFTARVRQRACVAVERRQREGAWRLHRRHPTSLMTGVAGIGIALLRAAADTPLPSILGLPDLSAFTKLAGSL